MLTIFLWLLLLYFMGFARTAFLLLGCLLTIVTLVFEMVCGGGLTYLFWPEWMRTFEIGEFWTNAFTSRATFEVWEAGAVPVIFIADLFRVAVRLVVTRCSVFTVGFFAFWLYCMFMLWSIILRSLSVRGK